MSFITTKGFYMISVMAFQNVKNVRLQVDVNFVESMI